MKNHKLLKAFAFLSLLLCSCLCHAYDLTVAKDGSGNYTTVQAAINAAPTGLTSAYTIYVKNGKYREKITVPSNKPFIQIIGESVANTIIYYDDPATILGTQGSASFTINATDFMAANVTFANTYGDGSQAVAVLVNADRAVFKNCRFLGNQDTLYVKGSGTPKSYFKNCYIDGNVDFIFGSGVAYFDSCVVYAKTSASTSTSYITAPNTPTGQPYGFIFNNARLPVNTGTTNYYLSRPWPSPSEAATAQKTVLLNSRLSSHIFSAGWTVWDANTITANTYYGEYQSLYFNGTPVNASNRVAWSYQLSAGDFSTYTFSNIFGAWNPCAVATGVCNPSGTDIAVSNFRATKGASTTAINWNISWPLTGIQYELYRSSDNISFSVVNTQTATTDSAINFTYTDANPPAGQSYYYYVRASLSGLANHITDTVSVSSVPTITVTGSLGSFLQGLGTPSSVQSYTVSGVNLTANISITPPSGYEVSSNGGTNWFTTPISLTQSGGTVSSTTISVRLNAGSVGTYNGNIVHASTGAATVNQPVTGTVQSAPLTPSTVVQQWFLTANNSDDAATRSTGVIATTPTFNKLFLSNGTTVTAVPAYSATHGQAYGPSAAGDGTWTSVGANLNRTVYEQFTVTANTGYSVRVDSIVLNSSFYNTSSNTKLAVVYSKSAFASDSANITGGFGPTGAALAAGANGAFATPILLTNETSGTNANYRLAFNSSTGVTLSAGQTLTIRLYNSCSSSSPGRYGKIKNLSVKGYACLPPSISTQPLSTQSVCQGASTSALSVAASGTSLTYTWFVNSSAATSGATIISGATASSYTPPSATAGTNYYYCVVTGGCGTVTSNFAEVIVNANPAITASAGANGSISPAGVTTLSCNGTGSQVYSITPNSGYVTSDVLVDGVSQGAISNYTFSSVTVNHTISATFAVACVNVGIDSATAGTSPLCSGQTTTLTANGVTGTNATVTWWTGTGGTGTNLGTGLSLANQPSGTYYARVTGNCGTPAEASVTVASVGNTFSGTGNWTDNARWSCGAPPSSGDIVSIAAGANAILNTNFTVGGSFAMALTSTLVVNPTSTLSISGTADFAGQSVTLKSDNTGTASIGQVSGTLNGATNVTVERYIRNNGFRSWRLLSVPVVSSQTIRQAWQEGDANPLPQQNNAANYGTQITGVFATQAAAAAAGFDSTSVQAGMLRWNGTGWSNIASTNQPINNFNSYFLYIRGERSQSVTGSVSNSSATTLRTKGAVFTGDRTTNVGANAFALIPNEYPSAISFTGLARTGGVNNLFYIWDSKKQNGNSLGTYQTFSSTNSFNCLISGGSYVLGQPNIVIESGQSFFVTSGAAGTITLKESAKTSGTNGSLGFRPVATSKIDTRLYNSLDEMLDANTVVFDAAYEKAVAEEDAPKLGNPGANFAIENSSKLLAIEGTQPIKESDAIQFRMWNIAQGKYKLELATSNLSLEEGIRATLEDNYLKTKTAISLSAITTVNFAVDGNAGSSAANRFKVVFAKAKPAITNSKQAFVIAPNPIENSVINLQLVNQPAGKYAIRIIGEGGQTTAIKTISHAGGSAAQSIILPATMASDTYTVEIVAPNKTKSTQKVVLK